MEKPASYTTIKLTIEDKRKTSQATTLFHPPYARLIDTTNPLHQPPEKSSSTLRRIKANHRGHQRNDPKPQNIAPDAYRLIRTTANLSWTRTWTGCPIILASDAMLPSGLRTAAFPTCQRYRFVRQPNPSITVTPLPIPAIMKSAFRESKSRRSSGMNYVNLNYKSQGASHHQQIAKTG